MLIPRGGCEFTIIFVQSSHRYHIKNDINVACCTYVRKLHSKFWCGKVQKTSHLEDPNIDGNMDLTRYWMGGHGLA
jgi:hypothetical protein